LKGIRLCLLAELLKELALPVLERDTAGGFRARLLAELLRIHPALPVGPKRDNKKIKNPNRFVGNYQIPVFYGILLRIKISAQPVA
jgi:hypothetical protein